MNILKNIWTKPRYTMRTLLDEGNEKKAFLVIALSSLILSFSQNAFASTIDEDALHLTFWQGIGFTLGGIVVGIIGWYVLSGLLYGIAKLLGGVGTYKGTRFAYAYGQLPYTIIGVLLIVPTFLILRENTFALYETLTITEQNWRNFANVFFLIGSIWSIVTTVFTLAEAHQITGWRSFFALLLFLIIIVILIVLIVVIVLFGFLGLFMMFN